jgi:RHS repeat-associated protein
MEVKQSGATIKTRWYAGSRYIKETTGGVTKEFTWIGGDAYSAPCLAVTQSGATTYYYLLRDHLGTITHVTDASGNVVNEYSFDAWGRRRNFTDWSYTVAAQTDILPDRGFTGHEYLPWFKLYNMNGRLYDPVVGRFLEPDPIIQDAFSTQNLNRYSYALNNPLKFTDPSGNSFKQTMDDWYGEGSYWYRGDAPGTWGNGSGPISGGGPGSGWNGPGLNGMYYDWETNSYRSTTFGNDEVGWGNAYNLASKAGASTSSPGAIESILGSIVNGDFNFGTYNAFGRNHIVIWPYGQKLNVGYALNGGLTSTNGTVFLGSNVAASVGSGNHWLGKVLNYSGKANDGLASTIGIREVFEWEYKRQAKLNRALSGNYSQTVTHSMRAIKAVGKFTGVASMGIAWADYANNNTTGNFIQALANTGLVFARVNPITGIIIGVADVTGASDYVYDQIGGLIDNY